MDSYNYLRQHIYLRLKYVISTLCTTTEGSYSIVYYIVLLFFKHYCLHFLMTAVKLKTLMHQKDAIRATLDTISRAILLNFEQRFNNFVIK